MCSLRNMIEMSSLIYGKISLRLKLYLDNFENLTERKVIEISEGGTFYVVNSLAMVFGKIPNKS